MSSKHLTVKARTKNQYCGRPGKQTSVTKNNFIEIRPILFLLGHLFSHDYFTCKYKLVFELGWSGSRQIKVAQPHQRGWKDEKRMKWGKKKRLTRKSCSVIQHLIGLCWHHVLHMSQTLSCSDWPPQPPSNSQDVRNGVMGEVMATGIKANWILKDWWFYVGANKCVINDRVA